MMLVLNDDDLARLLGADDAVRWVGEAIDAHHAGRLAAPARVHADLGDGRLVFTAGRLKGEWFGYRSYDTTGAEPGAQVVVVHDEATGEVRAVAVGNELGPRRTGAIGAAAADALAAPGDATVGLVGSGVQARTQLWALNAVRRITEVRVFSRNPEARAAFASEQSAVLGLDVRAVASAQEAVEEADVVVLATNSAEPVVRADWIGPDALLTSLGPKQRGRCELDVELVERAGLVVTDSPVQLDGYDPPHVVRGTAAGDRLVSLGAIRAGEVAVGPGLRVFLSVGLAGTEAHVLHRLGSGLSER